MNFLMNGKGAAIFVAMQGHLWSVKTGFVLDEIANSSVFDDHFTPEGITGKAKEKSAVVSFDFNDNIGPASNNVMSANDFVVWQSGLDNIVKRIFSSKKSRFHRGNYNII